jgi:hypothetical protein
MKGTFKNKIKYCDLELIISLTERKEHLRILNYTNIYIEKFNYSKESIYGLIKIITLIKILFN